MNYTYEDIKKAKELKAEGYNWVARDKEFNHICAFTLKPFKDSIEENSEEDEIWVNQKGSTWKFIEDNYFLPVVWENKKPTSIDRIISQSLIEEKEKYSINKPYLIKKGEIYYVPSVYQGSIIADKKSNLDKDIAEIRNVGGCVARTELETLELYKARKMQREYELWCMEYPCDWKDYEQEKNFICGFDIRKLEFIGKRIYLLEEKPQGTICCANKEHIQAFIDKVGKENFVKYVLEIGLKKYWLEV